MNKGCTVRGICGKEPRTAGLMDVLLYAARGEAIVNRLLREKGAVIVLLALLSLSIKNIHLGPTLPGFLSPNVGKVLVEKFGLGTISTVAEDMKNWINS